MNDTSLGEELQALQSEANVLVGRRQFHQKAFLAAIAGVCRDDTAWPIVRRVAYALKVADESLEQYRYPGDKP